MIMILNYKQRIVLLTTLALLPGSIAVSAPVPSPLSLCMVPPTERIVFLMNNKQYLSLPRVAPRPKYIPPSLNNPESSSCKVRVLLHKKDDSSPLLLQSEQGFYIKSSTIMGMRWYCSNKTLSIVAHKTFFIINGKRIDAPTLCIQSLDGIVGFENNRYKGDFYAILDNSHCYLINNIDVEEYIYCVLKSESWPGWPLEVNKAFAIACRSYVLAKMHENKRKLFHIKNSNIHQTYQGDHSTQRLREAVHQTQGLIMTHQKKPIVAMFDCCCGGIIPAHIDSIDAKRVPYLARTQVCTYCQSCKLFNWTFECSTAQLQKVLEENKHNVGTLKDILIIDKDKAGVIKKVLIKGSRKTVTLEGRQIYSLLPPIKSFSYDIKKEKNAIYFNGKGYGHHLGICQWGARAMIDHGFDHREILQFYYPGTLLMKLQKSLTKHATL